MILIGEKLNSSIPSVLKYFQADDEVKLTELITAQRERGADYIDLNTAMTDREIPLLQKYIQIVTANTDAGIVVDSPDPDVQLACLPLCGKRSTILNSVTAEQKYLPVIEKIAELNCGVIGMPLTGKKIPAAPSERLENAATLCNSLCAAGVKKENIYIDCLVGTAAAEENGATAALETVRLIHENLPGVKTVCGLSNVSFGLPMRGKLNAAYISMLCMVGLDAAICDVTSEALMSAYRAAEALLGRDEYCMEYISFVRELMP